MSKSGISSHDQYHVVDASRSETASLLIEHAPLIGLSVVYLGLAAVLTHSHPLEYLSLEYQVRVFVRVTPLALLSLIILLHMQNISPDRPGGPLSSRSSWVAIQSVIRTHAFGIRGAGGFVLAIGLYTSFLLAFRSLKSAIPTFREFTWDPALASIDRALHFGRDPWEWLHPVFGTPWATVSLDALYYVWFMIAVIVVTWQAGSRDRRMRLRFLLSLFLCWALLGNVVATLFASGGPIYYAWLFEGQDPFAGLIAYLEGVNASRPLQTLVFRDMLWAGYVEPSSGKELGIAAMPSLHVALPVLFALVSFQVSRVLGFAFVAYAILILIGSIHLAWHYAIDGYVSIAIVPIIWLGSGRFVDWYGAKTGVFT